MVVGLCHITLLIHDNRSLKGKRQVLKGVIEKVKHRFNVSVSEVGSHELWQRAEIGIATVGTDAAFVNSVLDKVLVFIEDMQIAEVTDSRLEIIHAGH